MQANSDALSYSQEAARCCLWTWPISKGQKGQHRNCLRFWCGEYLCKITKWYRQFLQSYRVHKAAWPSDSLKVQKGHTNVNVKLVRDFYAENIHVKLQHDTCNLRKVIAFTRSSQMLPAWKFIKVTQRSRSNLVEIIISRTSLPVQLQHDAGKFWCFIIFTRSCHLNIDLFQKVQKGQHQNCPRFWCGEYLCKITKRYRQFLQSYRVHKAAWPWASLKVQKCYTKANVEHGRDFYVENIHVKLQHDTGNLWRVITFTRFQTSAHPPAQATTIPFSLKGAEG